MFFIGRFMKKLQFALLLIGIVVLIILAFILQVSFSIQTKNFGVSCGVFSISILCLFCYKNALKPTEIFGPINTTKRYYEKKGELHKYKDLCKILFITTFCIGALSLIYGLGELCIGYLISGLKN